ncbi:hypothetical protein FACS1894199_09830 [Bacteroidia bacterium]|nr:hypothetical protein FACS1894199_09830 [Bacteroidia bacterium]
MKKKVMKRELNLIFSAVLLLAGCTDEDTNNISTGILPTEIEVVSLSSKVAFETVVAGAATANIYLVSAGGTSLLRTAVPVNGEILSVEFTTAELGLNKVGAKAYLEIEANGYTAPKSVISMVSAWNTPATNEKFTTLEASTLSDTVTFSVNIEEWMDATKLAFTATMQKNSPPSSDISSDLKPVPSKATSKQYIFSVAGLALAAEDTLTIVVKAVYDGGPSESKTVQYVVTADEFAHTNSQTITATDLLSEGSVSNVWSKSDSTTQSFYNLLTGKVIKGLQAARVDTLSLSDAKNLGDSTLVGTNAPKIFFAYTSDSLDVEVPQLLSGGDYDLSYAVVTTKAEFDANNRGTAATKIYGSFSGFAFDTYYAVKIVNTSGSQTFYGYFYVKKTDPVAVMLGGEGVSLAKYTFNYGLERDMTKE